MGEWRREKSEGAEADVRAYFFDKCKDERPQNQLKTYEIKKEKSI